MTYAAARHQGAFIGLYLYSTIHAASPRSQPRFFPPKFHNNTMTNLFKKKKTLPGKLRRQTIARSYVPASVYEGMDATY